MADDIHLPEDERVDPQQTRGETYFRRLGVPTNVFAGVLEGALQHEARAVHAATTDAQRDAQRWAPIGPRNVGGRIRALAQDPSNPNVLYAGAAQGGVWKTIDAGNTWQPLGAPDQAFPVGAIAIARKNPRVVYVGTGEPVAFYVSGRGLFKSTDGGDTFVRIAGTATVPMPAPVGALGAADRYARIVVDPEDANRFWAASPTGLWRFEPATGFVLEPVPTIVPPGDITDVAISIDPTEAAPPPGTPRRRLRIFAAVSGDGVYRGIFDRGAGPPATAWGALLPIAAPAATLFRIRLTLCHGTPNTVYAAFGTASTAATQVGRLFRSTNGGTTWTARTAMPVNAPWYSLAMECHPTNPNLLVGGDLNVYRTTNGGGSAWTRILNWLRYDTGDRAQHADQHAVVFDAADPRRVWIGNDGGVSLYDSVTSRWTKRSFDIVAAQFNDISVHPTLPGLMGGGLQDNGSWVGYGGTTWYHVGGGDGGDVAFEQGNPRRVYWGFFPGGGSAFGFAIGTVVSPVPAYAANTFVAGAVLPDVTPPHNRYVVRSTDVAAIVGSGPFAVKIEHHPQAPNHLLVGRVGGAAVSVNGGASFTTIPIAFANATAGVIDEASALAYANAAAAPAADDWWIGTSAGQVFMSQAGLGGPWQAIVVPWAAAPIWVSRIAVHPTNRNVVAIAGAGANGELFLSHDRGATWQSILGTATIAPAAAENLPPCPFTALAWDPVDPRTLYVGTLVGVYVAHDLPVPGGGPVALPAQNPHWRAFNEGLPRVQASDLAVVPVTNTLRCATFGRGVYEANLGATPAAMTIPPVQLSIRRHAMDDGRRGLPAANQPPNDLRRWNAGAAALDFTHAFDVRVDAPRFQRFDRERFGESLDGVEFDEQLTIDAPIVGDENAVYVQVQNRGSGLADDVQVHLYFASAPGAPAVAPPVDPALLHFPDEPDAASAWQRVGTPRATGPLRAGQPKVVRFAWEPPAGVAGQSVALLAMCTATGDPLVMPAAATAAIAFVTGEPRAALRIMTAAINPIYVRDGVDDDGHKGSVAWGGRSPDIVVVQASTATPAATFADATSRRLTDRVRPGNNFVYVRVTNRATTPFTADVDVYQVPDATPDRPGTWTLVRSVHNVAVPARGSGFATITPAAAPWHPGAPPAPSTAWILVALVSRTGDPRPDFTADVSSLATLWTFLRTGALADKAAMRAVRFQP